MPLNAQQEQIVKTLDASVNVVAGAGTGKTFTLTERIVSAIESSAASRPGDKSPTDHVLAITFTRKAAAELKSRVRRAFAEKAASGGQMAAEYGEWARTIDNAWISTIHSMAGRILKEHAIEFGIDPAFVALSNQQANSILAEAMNAALQEVESSNDEELKAFVRSRQMSAAFGPASLPSLVETLLGEVGYMPAGLDGVVSPEASKGGMEILSPFYRKAHEVKAAFLSDGWKPGEARKASELLPELEEALVAADAWMAGSQGGNEGSIEGLEEVLFSFPATTNAFGKSSDHKSLMLQYRRAYQKAAAELSAHPMAFKAKSLARFASLVKEHMDKVKSTGGTKFTESDLLERCNQLLALPENAHILEGYRSQFDYIMLDEFQDTDKLQMDIVGKLCKQPGPGGAPLSNVCTVGDMQQSIYRFRGGDVEETQKRITAARSGEAVQFELSGNYRSHPDILQTVEEVFSREDGFGDAFLKLDASSTSLDEECERIFSKRPRVTFDFVHGSRATKDSPDGGVPTSVAREVAAASIAAHFKELSDAGVPSSRMAVLLGKMTNAGVYAKALESVGLECAITGGSVFAEASEVSLVESLLRHAVNRDDDVPLLAALQSRPLSVSDDLLLSLTRPIGQDGPARTRLARSFASSSVPDGISPEDEASLENARRLLAEFCRNASTLGPSEAVRRFAVDSGLLGDIGAHMDASSMVKAANIGKCIRILKDMEADSSGVAEVSTRFSWHISTAKEAPGSLSSTGSDFVQIMTVHASKGLEFDHVAVAEVRDGTSASRSPLLSENIDESTFIAFKPEKGDFDDPANHDRYQYVCKFTFDAEYLGEEEDEDPTALLSGYERTLWQKKMVKEAPSPDMLLERLSEYEGSQELGEAKRLLYVAMTRARESLFVSHAAISKPEAGYKGAMDVVFGALMSHFGEAASMQDDSFDMTQMPIRARRRLLASMEDVESALMEAGAPQATQDAPEDEGCRSIDVPIFHPEPPAQVERYSRSHDGICSYSSISKDATEEGASTGGMQGSSSEGEKGAAAGSLRLEAGSLNTEARNGVQDGSATDLGTAFHRLAQMAIEDRPQEMGAMAANPGMAALDAQARSCNLTDGQRKRLAASLERWFGSAVCRELCSHERVLAEVPFCVEVGDSGASFVLEGEIDALAFDEGSDAAFLVDYKTGDSHGASPDALSEKHRLQSQCYAYALMKAGFGSVECRFVRVEEERSEDDGAPNVVCYSYSSREAGSLEDEILRSYRYSIGEKTDI